MSIWPEMVEKSEQIGEVAFDWVKRYGIVVSSTRPVLDKLEQGKLRLTARVNPLDNPLEDKNMLSPRLHKWAKKSDGRPETIEAARGITCGLIVVGECVRLIRYLQASSQEDYNKRLKKQPADTGLKIPDEVRKYCEVRAEQAKKDQAGSIDLSTDLKKVVTATELTMDSVSYRAKSRDNDFGEKKSESVYKLDGLARGWLKFSVASIARASEMLNLPNVPLVTPESYGHTSAFHEEIAYPFGGPGPWVPDPAYQPEHN